MLSVKSALIELKKKILFRDNCEHMIMLIDQAIVSGDEEKMVRALNEIEKMDTLVLRRKPRV